MAKNPPAPSFKEKEVETKNASNADKSRISHVTGRFQEMQTQRASVDRNWNIYQAQIDALYRGYQDGRPSSNVPLARSLRELFVAEAVSMPAIFSHKADDSEYEANAVANEEVWKYNWRVNNYDWSILQSEYTCSTFGTCVYYVHFNKTIKEQWDMKSITGLGDLEWQKKYLVKNQIMLENFDIRRFYADNRVTDFNKATDCVAIQVISFEEFQCFKNNPLYKNIDYVQGAGYNTDPLASTSQEERTKEGKYVHLYHYWNIEKDWYCVVANNQQIIREHPIMSTMKGEKALPFVMRQFSYNENSLYGVGLPQMCANYNSNINNLSEMLMESVMRSNSEIVAIGDGVDFKGQKWVYGNKIAKFSGNLAQNFKQITGTPPNSAMFSMLDRMYTDIAVYTGIDVRNIIGDTTPTAFQADLQKESSMKRIRTWLQNRNFAFERLADLMQDCLQTYFPIDVPRQLVDSLDKYKPKTPSIEIIGKKYDARAKRFVTTKPNEKSSLDITKEILEGDIYVDVSVNDSVAGSRALQKAQVLEFMNSLGNIVQSYMVAQQAGVDMESIMPIQKVLEKMSKDYNIPTENPIDEKEMEGKKEETKAKLMAFAASMGVPSNPPAGPLANIAGPQAQSQPVPQA